MPMFDFGIMFAIVPAVILFLFGIEHFSSEMQRIAGERFREVLSKLASSPVLGALFGAFVTAIIQSSTATAVITVSLVDAGVISFSQSLGIIFGLNIGTAFTALLVAYKMTSFAPLFIFIGFILNIFGGRYKFIGKPIFYFGLVFFSLNLISNSIGAIKTDPDVFRLLAQTKNPLYALLIGLLATTVLQSSSVTLGIAIILSEGGLIGVGQAIPLILGSKIGTTFTAFFSSLRMGLHARRTAAAHVLFNLLSVLALLPFLNIIVNFVFLLGGSSGLQVANAYLLFSIAAALIFLSIESQFRKLIESAIPGEEEELLFKPKFLKEKIENPSEAIGLVEKEFSNYFDIVNSLLDESMRILKTKKDTIARVRKLESLSDYLDEKIEQTLLSISRSRLELGDGGKVVLLVRLSNAMEQLGDAGEDLGELSEKVINSNLSISPESQQGVESMYEIFRKNVLLLREKFPFITQEAREEMRKNDVSLQHLITHNYAAHLDKLPKQKTYAGSMFVEFVSVIEQANFKVREMRKISEEYSESEKKENAQIQ